MVVRVTRAVILVTLVVSMTLVSIAPSTAACESPCDGRPGAGLVDVCDRTCRAVKAIADSAVDIVRNQCVPHC